MSRTFLFAGTYQLPGYGLASGGDGIHVYELEPETGALTHVFHYATRANTSILAISPNRRNLYATDEQRDHGGVKGAGGGVLAFRIDRETGHLELLGTAPTYSPLTSYVNVDPTGSLLAFSNHGSTAYGEYRVTFRRGPDGKYVTETETDRVSVGVYALGADGSILGEPDIHPLDVNLAHFHSAMFSPSGKWLLACDKGTDKICVYRVDLENRRVLDNDPPYWYAGKRIAPRHIAFLPGTPYFFVCNELGYSVSAYRLDEETGVITPVDNKPTLPMQPDDAAGATADIRINNGFLYVSNRFRTVGLYPSYIAVYRIGEDGRLSLAEYRKLAAENPRGFNFDPSGRFLYTADMDSDSITRYDVDPAAGTLSNPQTAAQIGTPCCIQIAAL